MNNQELLDYVGKVDLVKKKAKPLKDRFVYPTFDKWKVVMRVDGKLQYFGTFKSEELAKKHAQKIYKIRNGDKEMENERKAIERMEKYKASRKAIDKALEKD